MEEIVKEIMKNICEHRLIAIDGSCAAGKSTLADMLMEWLTDCAVVHADHFFLRPEQRTAERLDIPGGNIDFERLRDEVLIPASRGESFSYRRFDCGTMSVAEEIFIENKSRIIVEGSYSCRPGLWEYYGLHIFLTAGLETRLRRIERRGGADCLPDFRDKWIPLEEKYFSEYRIAERCELLFDTGGLFP